MSDNFWKIMSNKRREERQAHAVDDKPRHRKKRKNRKQFSVEMKMRPGQKCWFSWHKEWSSHGKYETFKAAEQAMASLERHSLWGGYMQRIVDAKTGRVLKTNEEEFNG